MVTLHKTFTCLFRAKCLLYLIILWRGKEEEKKKNNEEEKEKKERVKRDCVHFGNVGHPKSLKIEDR